MGDSTHKRMAWDLSQEDISRDTLNLTISQKLWLGIGTLLFLFLLLGLHSALILNKSDKKIREVTDVAEPISATAFEMEISLEEIGLGVLGYLHDPTPSHLKRIERGQRQFAEFLEHYHALSPEGEAVTTLQNMFISYSEMASHLVNLTDHKTLLRSTKGIEDEGIIGEFRTAIHAVEAKIEEHNISDLMILMLQIRRREKDFLLRGRNSYVDNLKELVARFKAQLDHAPLTINQRQEFNVLIDNYQMRFSEVVAIHKEIVALETRIESELTPEFVSTGRSIHEFLEDNIRQGARTQLTLAKHAVHQAYEDAIALTIALIFTGLVIGLFVGALTRRSVTDPVKKLVIAANEVSNGNFTQRVELDNTDELGLLGDAFNGMTGSLAIYVAELQQTQTELREQSQALVERIRELDCLYSIAHIAEQSGMTLAEKIQHIVISISSSWEACHNAGARVDVNGEAYCSENYVDALEGYITDIRVRGQKIGELKITIDGTGDRHEWKTEEQNLTRAIAGRIGDIVENAKNEEEKHALEIKLRRAQQMEAIGTLSGGVAHDLNNILAGLVGYPELLLLELSPDSSMRKPLETMKTAGEKAAAIVQDLLTLSRRGVTVSEAVNLNDVISEYLRSPEHNRLMLFHPRVHIKTALAGDILTLMGSSVHLSKLVMNLLSNAAEAMPDGGHITITTENCYVDQTISGYESVTKGDYIVLRICDCGVGIEPDDLDQIFEPFFTKKVMGRSGTGLGMAVVWGTVKDHNGYIDVDSRLNKGTTFTIYLPASRGATVTARTAIPISDYQGAGETILVVDDVALQLTVARGMLERLGYNVITVSNGEEAITLLRETVVDLVVLDMIMDPGIDGLETYRRINHLIPAQKAIIASGFSENNRVQAAQQLGAGIYVRKPYVIEQLGIAVRDELARTLVPA
ncbi:MAG: ATP-binding protein [Pseudomonadota bacterium]